MSELVLVIGTGLVAGVLHVVSGPDHMAAVLPYAVDAPKRSTTLGILWGLGHGLGVVGLGALFVVLRFFVAPDSVENTIQWISQGSELLVGVLLVALGLWALRRSRWVVVHHHTHDHPPKPVVSADDVNTQGGGHAHAHPHVHFNDPTVGKPRHTTDGRHLTHHHSTLGFGFIHGLAGVGHLLAASPMLVLGTAMSGLYLASYLLGGMAAMTGVAYFAGALVRKPAWIPSALRLAGAGSVAIGLFWVTSFVFA